MSITITSAVAGTLTQDNRFNDWWHSNPLSIPFLDDEELSISFLDYDPEKDPNFLADADAALANFMKLDTNYRDNISHLVFQHCKNFLEMIDYDDADKAMHDLEDPVDIWPFVHPSNIHVSRRPYNDKDVYVSIVCNCDWEQEHGLQLVFRQGKKITRVSDQDGHLTEADAYDKPDVDDELLSKF